MAMVIAISASVTVSIGELTMGVDRRNFFVRFVVMSTCTPVGFLAQCLGESVGDLNEDSRVSVFGGCGMLLFRSSLPLFLGRISRRTGEQDLMGSKVDVTR